MSHLNPGLISAYNSLTDRHLAGYFSNTRIRRHLQRAGLITRSGRIVPDREYRHKLIQRAHQRHVRECLAQAVFHKVLEMERVYQIEIKRKLEEFARRERMHQIKVERSKKHQEDIIRILSPRPPKGARCIRKQHSGPEGEHSESSESPGSSRPNTAPGKMQRPVRLKPIHSNSTTASLRRSSPYRLLASSNENEQPVNSTMEKTSRRRLTTTEISCGISPYCLPVINNFVTPVPPATKRRERAVKVSPSGGVRGRRLRPTTASSRVDVDEDPPMLRSSVQQSRVCVNMMYFGKTVHLSHDLTDMRDEVKVFQQHCGGENLCVFKGKLREGETFQFVSRRHRGFPFSLTFFLNGLQVERLSSCCEFKHRKGSRLGGRHGHFGFCSVEAASPCYKCIIAMGLDKKPTPPPKKVKEDGGGEESFTSPKVDVEMETERTGEDAASRSESETSRPQNMDTKVKEEAAAQEEKVRHDYEEDFEADDEGPVEDVEAKERKPSSPSGETETQVKDKDSETEDDEKDEDIKSHSGSSSSGSEREDSDAEAGDSSEDDKVQVGQEENAAPPPHQVKDELNPEEIEATEVKAAELKDVQDSAEDSTEIDVSDTSIPSGNDNQPSEDTSGDKEEKTVDDSKPEEQVERAKSVQEKLAQAILKTSQCSSEPELSDTSTEEEEESTHKGPEEDTEDALKAMTFTEQQQTPVEETPCQDDAAGKAKVLQDHEETSEVKEEESQSDKEKEKSDGTKDETVRLEEEDEEAATAEEEEDKTTKNDTSEDTGDTSAALPHGSEEELIDDDKISQTQEDATVKSGDAAAAAERDEEEEKTAVGADETGQGAKSGEGVESSVLEPNTKTDDTAVPEEAEAMTASETMEMKAEPSEEREALNCEEASGTDAEKRQRGDGEDRDAETEVTAENSSCSLEGSGDTAVEKTADKNESEKQAAKGSKGDREDAGQNDQQQHTETASVEVNDKLEEKCEEKINEAKQSNPDEIREGNNGEESKVDDEDKTEDEKNNEWEANAEGKTNEEAEKPNSDQDRVENKDDKTERDEDLGCVKNNNEEEESSITNGKMNTAADEVKDDEAEKGERDQNEDDDVKNKDDEESEEKTVEAAGHSEVLEESEKSADADLDKDDVKVCDKNHVESEDVTNSEATQGTEMAKEMAEKTAEETAEEMAEETPSNAVETEDVQRGSDDKEKFDVKNGEMNMGSENKPQEDEGEGENNLRTAAEDTDDGRQTEIKEISVEAGDAAETNDAKGKEAPCADVESEVKEGDDGVEKQDNSGKNEEPETSGTKAHEESKADDKDTEQDENGNISDPKDENRDSDFTKSSDNVQSSASEVIAADSGGQPQTSAATPLDSDDTDHNLDQSAAPSETKPPQTDEHAADLCAAEGDNGADTEEASKASEEGASVLLKPHTQLPHNKDNTDQSGAAGEDPPEALVRGDNTDLVTNWVTMHQTSKYFETFVEPLEDLNESDTGESNSTELQRSASPLQMEKTSENAEEVRVPKQVNKSRNVETVILNHEDDKSGEKRTLQEQEEDDLSPKTESEQHDEEDGKHVKSEDKGSRRSVEEDKVQDSSEINDISKTEVESIAGTHRSLTSRRAESISENQTEEKIADWKEKTAIEEIKDLLPLSQAEEHRQHSMSPERLSKVTPNALEDGETWEKSEEVTEITEFTASRSDDGSQEDLNHKDAEQKPLDGGINGDKRDAQLIQDIKHTLSKERLGSFSVDETLFGRSSHPLLMAARTESGH